MLIRRLLQDQAATAVLGRGPVLWGYANTAVIETPAENDYDKIVFGKDVYRGNPRRVGLHRHDALNVARLFELIAGQAMSSKSLERPDSTPPTCSTRMAATTKKAAALSLLDWEAARRSPSP